MFSETVGAMIPVLVDFVNRDSHPHFFLSAASTNETKLVDRVENVRRLLVYLQKSLGDRFFEATEPDCFQNIIGKCRFYVELGPEKQAIPSILASVNRFVEEKARGNLIEYSHEFNKPKDMVENISENIERMAHPYAEKPWMYMRWMVRPNPDLQIFPHFLPKDLQIPLTTDIANVATSLGLINKADPSLWKDEKTVAETREKITEYAETLFPEDPAKADYPFFLLGRWLRGTDLNEQTLRHSLQLFNEVYEKTGYSCVDYQIMAYVESGWEKWLEDNLQKMKIPYQLKPFKFPLTENLTYTPDFILKEIKINGKRTILEPHGIMEEKDTHKYQLFKQLYGSECYLLLIMRNDDIPYYRALGLLSDQAYDDIYPKEYLGNLLRALKNRTHTPNHFCASI